MKFIFVGNFQVDYSSENHHAQSLEALGHEVVKLQEGEASGDQILSLALEADGLIFVHTHSWITPGKPMAEVFATLKSKNIPSITYHLDLWLGIERQKDLEQDEFYKSIGWFFTVDRLMADYFNEHTPVKGRYLQAGVFHKECVMLESEPVDYDVIFVGSKGYHPEWQWRPQLINWLQETYGSRFLHVGGDGATGTVRGMALNQIYANAKVAIGDSLCLNYNYPYYWSDRVYETLGRGGFMLHPYILGMEKQFVDGAHLKYFMFGNFDLLKSMIDYYIEHAEERERIRLGGHKIVSEHYTYKQRWQQIISEVYGE